jgi:hypothetical protein
MTTPRQRALTDAFLACAGALHRRPEPRHAWDSRARGDGRAAHPANDAVILCRGAMHAALETNDPLVIRQTRLAIEEYFDLCADEATNVGAALIDQPTITDVVTSDCEAVAAIVAANESQSLGALANAKRKARSAADALVRWLSTADSAQRTSSLAEWI